MFNFFRHHTDRAAYDGPREYKQVAVTPEAHARIVELADKKGKTIVDTVDNIMGVKK